MIIFPFVVGLKRLIPERIQIKLIVFMRALGNFNCFHKKHLQKTFVPMRTKEEAVLKN